MRQRRATTQLELIIATVLIAATLATITLFRKQTILSGAKGQRASFAQSHLLNFRREVSTWSFDDINSATIVQVAGDDSNFLPQAQWIAEVTELEQPIAGKQVVLSLQWNEGELKQTSPPLTFWVKRP